MNLRSVLGFVAASALSASLTTTRTLTVQVDAGGAGPSKSMPACRLRQVDAGAQAPSVDAGAPSPDRSKPPSYGAPQAPSKSTPGYGAPQAPSKPTPTTPPRRPRASRRRATAPRRPPQVEADYGATQAPSKRRRATGPAGPGQVGPAGLSGGEAKYCWIAPRSFARPGILVVSRPAPPSTPASRFTSVRLVLSISPPRASRLHLLARASAIDSSLSTSGVPYSGPRSVRGGGCPWRVGPISGKLRYRSARRPGQSRLRDLGVGCRAPRTLFSRPSRGLASAVGEPRRSLRGMAAGAEAALSKVFDDCRGAEAHHDDLCREPGLCGDFG